MAVSKRSHCLFVVTLILGIASPAMAQESMRDVLSFLVTNRSIATDDFVRDEQAATTTRDAIANVLAIELGSLPIASSASGFVYRLDPTLGTMSRLSDSFGPFFTERALTTGAGLASFSISYRSAEFDDLDGRNLRDGSLLSTAATLAGESQPFDVETITLRLRADTVTASTSVGITDRVEVSAAIPFVKLRMSGQRMDTYRGRQFPQATVAASAAGLGDVVLRGKYNFVQRAGAALAIGTEVRLATGDEEQLLGAGESSVRPRLLASLEQSRVTLHGDVGYAFGGLTDEFDYSGAVTVIAAPQLTIVAELSGRRFDHFGRLSETVEPHPRLANIETIRLTAVDQPTNRLMAVAGVKWNVARTFVLSANVVRPLTSIGLNAPWVPSVTIDYSFGQ